MAQRPDHKSPLRTLGRLGQSVWLDHSSRALIRSRTLHRLIAEDGLDGLTTNPTTFEHAIIGSDAYDADIIALADAGFGPDEILERLMVDEVREACDAFRPQFESSGGRQGFVSLEVSPVHADDTEGSVAHARQLWAAVGRRNLMIKIPATDAGLGAAEHCLTLGLNVNLTLVFSRRRHRQAQDVYLAALGARRVSGLPLDSVTSVASIFVSRVDRAVDARLDALASREAHALRGGAGIACAAGIYESFTSSLAGPVWRSHERDGARPQRPLWAAMRVKDPTLPPLHYCEALVAPLTVVTLQPDTLAAYRSDGAPALRLDDETMSWAQERFAALHRIGIGLDAVGAELEEEGVRRFAASWGALLEAVERKSAVLATRA